MNNDISFVLDAETVEKLNVFSELLPMEPSTILREALQDYFQKAEKQLLEKKLAEKDPMTNLDFDEFWDGVEL